MQLIIFYVLCVACAQLFLPYLPNCNFIFSFKNVFVFIYLFSHHLFICNWLFIYLVDKLLRSNMSGNTYGRVLKGEMYAHSVQKSRFSLQTEEKPCKTAL